jgi:hypothetical protein
MSYKDDNSFDGDHRTANAVLCDTVHRLYQDFLLSKYHADAWYMCKHNFIFATKKSKAFPVPTVTTTTNAEQDCSQMSYTEFRPNRATHMRSTGMDSFTLSCMKLNTPNKFLWMSPLLNFIQIGQKK